MKNIPTCVGVIIDGNRRWAKERGLPTLEGHTEGVRNVKRFVEWAMEAGIPHIVGYIFSTENWNRSEEEKAYLFSLFKKAFTEEMDELIAKGVRVQFIGERKRFSTDIQESITMVEQQSAGNLKITVTFAFSYGGRAEIVDTVNRLLAEGAANVSEKTFAANLWTGLAQVPDPDLIIRTGGEKRLSNFLPWQGTYAELFFVNTYWPGFTKEDFTAILEEYGERERRHGK